MLAVGGIASQYAEAKGSRPAPPGHRLYGSIHKGSGQSYVLVKHPGLKFDENSE